MREGFTSAFFLSSFFFYSFALSEFGIFCKLPPPSPTHAPNPNIIIIVVVIIGAVAVVAWEEPSQESLIRGKGRESESLKIWKIGFIVLGREYQAEKKILLDFSKKPKNVLNIFRKMLNILANFHVEKHQ